MVTDHSWLFNSFRIRNFILSAVISSYLYLTFDGKQFRTAGSACATSSSKPCTKLTLHCNHRSGHLKTEHTESLFLLRRLLGIWPRGPTVRMRSELLVVHEKLGQLPLLTVYVVPV
jgi:hypothetical protein